MSCRFYTFFFALLFSVNLIGQETTPLTTEASEDAAYRMGKSNYSAKPKNAWELGVHAGHFLIDGDVDRTLPAGFGLGLHLRKALHYAFSIRADLFYGQACGLDPQPWTHVSIKNSEGIGGGLNEQVYTDAGYGDRAKTDGVWFPSHKTTQIYGGLQGIINVGNILFHNNRNKWNWYLAVGAALSTHTTKLDLLDGNGNPYTNLVSGVGFNTTNDFDTKAGRSAIKKALRSIYDGVYETEGPKKAGIFRLGDKTNIHPMFTGSVGVSRKISKRFNISLEHQVMATDNDYLDGIRFRTNDDITQDVDIEHYTNFRLGINLGNFDKVSEPLYWLNPLESTMNDIAELKARPKLDLTDTDSDGIIDMLDQEPNSATGAIVDTRGVTMDSDSDGIADHQDKEPFSKPGYPVDKAGVANVPCCMTDADVAKVVETKAGAMIAASTSKNDACGKWFLPMIHFDLDKSKIKPEFYGHLHHVANVMKLCPNACVTVVGHTDSRNSNDYNQSLSYARSNAAIDYLVSKYGIDRSRFKLMYGGEETPLVTDSRRESEHYMNRRVEFRLCDGTDADMSAPANTHVGSTGSERRASKSSSSTNSIFKGNKNSGF